MLSIEKGDMTLTEITRAGINFRLKDLSKGFSLMVEGGKIDWACHSKRRRYRIPRSDGYGQCHKSCLRIL